MAPAEKLEAIERLFERHAAVVREALKTAETPSKPTSNPTLADTCEGKRPSNCHYLRRRAKSLGFPRTSQAGSASD